MDEQRRPKLALDVAQVLPCPASIAGTKHACHGPLAVAGLWTENVMGDNIVSAGKNGDARLADVLTAIGWQMIDHHAGHEERRVGAVDVSGPNQPHQESHTPQKSLPGTSIVGNRNHGSLLHGTRSNSPIFRVQFSLPHRLCIEYLDLLPTDVVRRIHGAVQRGAWTGGGGSWLPH